MNNKMNIEELQAALQQERIRNKQLELKSQQSKEELENLLSFFNSTEQEIAKEVLKYKKLLKHWQILAEKLKTNIEGEQNKNKVYKDLILKIGRIALECEKCKVKDAAEIRIQCPVCQEKKLKEIAELF